MPVLWAKGEAEALCAQLNNEGHVDACITADSDAFLFGAKTVIKVLKSNCKVRTKESTLDLCPSQKICFLLHGPWYHDNPLLCRNLLSATT